VPAAPELIVEENQMAADRQGIVDGAHGRAWQELTAEERGTWAGHLVLVKVARGLMWNTDVKFLFQAEQRGKVEAICQEVGRGFAGGTRPWTADELNVACAKALRRVVAEVLTDEEVVALGMLVLVRANPYQGDPWETRVVRPAATRPAVTRPAATQPVATRPGN